MRKTLLCNFSFYGGVLVVATAVTAVPAALCAAFFSVKRQQREECGRWPRHGSDCRGYTKKRHSRGFDRLA